MIFGTCGKVLYTQIKIKRIVEEWCVWNKYQVRRRKKNIESYYKNEKLIWIFYYNLIVSKYIGEHD